MVVLNGRDLLGLVDITLRQASGASALFRIKSSKYLGSKTKNDAEMKGQKFSHHFTIFVFATTPFFPKYKVLPMDSCQKSNASTIFIGTTWKAFSLPTS